MIDNNQNNLKALYTTLFSQKFSPDGNHLAVCSNFGEIALFNLKSAFSADNGDQLNESYLKFKAKNCSLYSLEKTNDYLICGALNEIIAWKWSDLLNHNHEKVFWTIKLPNESTEFVDSIETNSLVFDSKGDSTSKRLFCAGGNGEIYCFDLEYGKLIKKYNAHRESIYEIVLKNNSNELVSASEDGCVKIFDLRTAKAEITLKPHEHSICSRPQLGHHVNCVAIDDDNWMICGGGPKLAMWHLRSLKPMNILEPDEKFMPNACVLNDNQILTGGNTNCLYTFTYDNKLKSEISTSTNCIYDIQINYASKFNKVMSLAGNGCAIDLCIRFSYKSLSLKF